MEVLMVSHVSLRWNTVFEDSVNLHLRLQKLGCISRNGTVVVLSIVEGGKQNV